MNEPSLNIYRLVPDAPPEDPNWDLAAPMGVIVVRAESPADARVVASQAEMDFPEMNARPGDGVKTDWAAAVRNDKLYRVEEDSSGRFSAEGERAVLDSPDKRPEIKPAQHLE